MKNTAFLFLCAFATLAPANLFAQSALNQNPSRSIGTLKFELNPKSGTPNIVEGREFATPWYLTIDKSSTPPALYVSDVFNNRVLAWRDATTFTNGATADLVIGQLDKFSTIRSG